MSDVEFPQPETVEVSENQYAPPPPVPVNEWKLMSSRVGDIIVIPADHDIPDGWLKCEARTLNTEDWPEFAQELGINPAEDPTFDLPDCLNTELQTVIIRMR